MPDYIYGLETRLSKAQQNALQTLRNVALEAGATIFLTGGAVRDLTGGGSIRDLDVTVQGEALKMRKSLEKVGAEVVGENAPAQQLFLLFSGGVRVELASAMTVTYPKPGKPKYALSTLSDDLRRRDFTANAMAISLNEGSYGLLMDPLNGVADIENRELRLVSNYGFIEDPSRLVRAARLSSRLGWQMEEKTRARFKTATEENYIENINPWNVGYELEEIFHEEDPIRVIRALEADGWMKSLFPALSSAKANSAALRDLQDKQGQLQTQGIQPDTAALGFNLVTGKMAPADIKKLQSLFVRPGFVREIEGSEGRIKDFTTRFTAKDVASPSATWKLLHSSEPNLVLGLMYASKSAGVQTRLKTFLTDSPTARQRIPYQLMQEMRIVPDLPIYAELADRIFFELMDNKLSTPEEMKAYLEPHSPPAPPPPVNLRRPRAKKEARPSRAKAKKAAAVEAAAAATAVTEATPAPTQAETASNPAKAVAPAKSTAPAKTASPAKTAAPSKATPVAAKSAPAKAAKANVAESPGKSPVKAAAKKAAPVKLAKKPGQAPTAATKTAKPAVKKAAKPVKAPIAKKSAVKTAAGKPTAKKTPAKAVSAKKSAAKKADAKKTVAKKGGRR